MKIKNIKNYVAMEKYLKNHSSEAKKLGFHKRLPHHTTLSYFNREYVETELDKKLEFIKKKFIEIVKEYKLVLDFPYDKRNKTIENKPSDKIFKENICKKILKIVKNYFPITLKPNAIYTVNHYWDLLVHMALTGDFAEDASENLRLLKSKLIVICKKCNRILIAKDYLTGLDKDKNIFHCEHCSHEERISPSADALLYHIKKQELESIFKNFQTFSNAIYEDAKRKGDIDKANKLGKVMENTIGIDSTNWYTYPDLTKKNVNHKWINKVEPKDGTECAYSFIMLDILEHGRRFTSKVLPYTPATKVKCVEALLSDAREKNIKIKLFLADKAYYDDKIREILKKYHINYITPVNRSSEHIKKRIEIMDPPDSYPFQTVTGKNPFNLVVVKGRLKKRPFKEVKYTYSTNIKTSSERECKKISYDYKKRWGSETANRIKKKDFLPMTTSKNPIIRYFYFLFCNLIYNLWFLIDLYYWIEKYKKLGTFRKIKAKNFLQILELIICDPG
jgi:hypothetical protein